MAFRTSKMAALADGSNPAKMQPSEMNFLTTAPVPGLGDVWIEITGTSPNRFHRLWIYDTVDSAWHLQSETQF